MKQILFYLSLCSLALFFNCSSEELLPKDTKQEIQLSSSIAARTRGINMNEQDQLINLNQQVGVTIVGGSMEHNNVKWISDGYGKLENSGNRIYYSPNRSANIYAYQPYNSAWTDIFNSSYEFSVQTDQTTYGYANSDLLWATPATSSVGDAAVKLSFNHMLSKINVYLTSEDGTDVSDATITLKNVEKTASFSNGVVTKRNGDVGDVIAGTYTNCATAIVVPQTLRANETFIEIIQNGHTYEYKSTSDRELLSGRLYTYRLKINSNGMIVLDDSDVNPWIDGDEEEINGEYMHFIALEDGVKIGIDNFGTSPNLLYSKNKQDWTVWDYSTIDLQRGEVLYLKGDNPQGISQTNYNDYDHDAEKYRNTSTFTTTGEVSAGGNIMSLLYNDDFKDKKVIPSVSCFTSLFWGTTITTAPVLPATTLTDYCYSHMFYGCTNLKQIPELPAKTLADYCYWAMFGECISLTEADLPATTLVGACYDDMFFECFNLSSIKAAFTKVTQDHFSDWLDRVAPEGIFYKKSDAIWTNDEAQIPPGWTVVIYDSDTEKLLDDFEFVKVSNFSSGRLINSVPYIPGTTEFDDSGSGWFENPTKYFMDITVNYINVNKTETSSLSFASWVNDYQRQALTGWVNSLNVDKSVTSKFMFRASAWSWSRARICVNTENTIFHIIYKRNGMKAGEFESVTTTNAIEFEEKADPNYFYFYNYNCGEVAVDNAAVGAIPSWD